MILLQILDMVMNILLQMYMKIQALLKVVIEMNLIVSHCVVGICLKTSLVQVRTNKCV